MDDEEDRCPTPTLKNPYPRPPLIKSSPLCDVEVVGGGAGGFDAMRKQMATLVKNKQDRCFSLLVTDIGELAKEGATFGEGTDRTKCALIFLAWRAVNDERMDRYEAEVEEKAGREDLSIDDAYSMNVYDFLCALKVRSGHNHNMTLIYIGT